MVTMCDVHRVQSVWISLHIYVRRSGGSKMFNRFARMTQSGVEETWARFQDTSYQKLKVLKTGKKLKSLRFYLHPQKQFQETS